MGEEWSDAGPGTRLEDLVPGVRVTGVAGTGPVQVVDLRWFGSNAVLVTYTDHHGNAGQAVLNRDRERGLGVEAPGRTRAFDGDAEAWRLAAEALRIRYAALFDPMLAVTTSDLQPLPHQIEAVYRELLPRTPLRFLLADDPGRRQDDHVRPVRQGADPPGGPGPLPDRRPGRAVSSISGWTSSTTSSVCALRS